MKKKLKAILSYLVFCILISVALYLWFETKEVIAVVLPLFVAGIWFCISVSYEHEAEYHEDY